jgi:hypothetical protein
MLARWRMLLLGRGPQEMPAERERGGVAQSHRLSWVATITSRVNMGFSRKVIHSRRDCVWLLMLCSAVSLNLSLPSARADTLTVAFPAAITVPEDNQVHAVAYVLTNVSGGDITIGISGTSGPAVFAGDPSDTGFNVSLNFGSCFFILANGAQCIANTTFMVPDGTGEMDADFGQFTLTTGIGFSVGGVSMSTGALVTTVTVTDPVPGPIAGAGLPGLLLASGGLLAWWRRRQRIRLNILRTTSFAAASDCRTIAIYEYTS